MKVKVSVEKDKNGRLTSLQVRKGKQKKGVRLDFVYGVDGYVRDILFQGKSKDMPSFAEIIDLVNEGFIERIGNIKNIENIENIETIETVDLVSLIALISTVSEVTNIKNIESIDLIDEITKITDIESITAFLNIQNAPKGEQILNGSFENMTVGEPDDWTKDPYHINAWIDAAEGHTGSHAVWSNGRTEYLYQILENLTPVSSLTAFAFWMKTGQWNPGEKAEIDFVITYSDDTTTSFSKNTTTDETWVEFDILSELDADKTIKKIAFRRSLTETRNFMVDDITLMRSGFIVEIDGDVEVVQPTAADLKATVTQAAKDRTITGTATVTQSGDVEAVQPTRTDFKNQPEREDLLIEHKDFSTSGSPQAVLAAVAAQKHKIYACGYEADADGTMFEFQATIATVTKKFCRKVKKGVWGQTFLHPVVCDTNTALNFLANGANVKVWIQYKTE